MKKKLTCMMLFIMSVICNFAVGQSETNTIAVGGKLREGQRLISANGKYVLAMQADGNLCVREAQGNAGKWCSMVHLGNGHYITLQEDGNFVVKNKANKTVWNTMTVADFDPKYGTADWKPTRAVLEDDGTLVLYSLTNKRVWANTDKAPQPIVSPGVGYTGRTAVIKATFRLPGSSKEEPHTVEVNERGEVFFNGDVNLGSLEVLKQSTGTSPAQNSRLWDSSTVYYDLPTDHKRKDIIEKGIAFLGEHTTICMKPVTRTKGVINQKDYVKFIMRDGNWSALGRVGGMQEISIENNDISTVIHEVMHALGFHHTQCREDRDNYVTIFEDNIDTTMLHNFQKVDDKESNLGKYDYTSCMHYSSYAFAKSKGLITIYRKDGKSEEMGSSESMSETDVSNIAAIYPKCPEKKSVNPLPIGKFTKTKAILNQGESLKMGETLTSENNQYQCRLIKQTVAAGRGTEEQSRFIIDKITVTDGMITNRVEIWNKECEEGIIYGLDVEWGGKDNKQNCFKDTPREGLRILAGRHFGQIKLENDGSLSFIYDGYYKNKMCPADPGGGQRSNIELHYRTPPALIAQNKDNRLEIGQTLTSDNNQFQAKITPEKRFVIEKITLGTRENGEKYVASREAIWDKECKQDFIDIGTSGFALQPDCFKKEVPVNASSNNSIRLPQPTEVFAWKLENDGTIKWYRTFLDKNPYVTCDPYK